MTRSARRSRSIIYYSISGFGQTGPLAERPAMDPVLQAFTGIVDENRGEHDNHPHRIAISLIDMYTGCWGSRRSPRRCMRDGKKGSGPFVELSLMHGGAMLSVIRLMAQYLEHGKAQRTSMPNGVFTTADGQLNITMVRPGDWPLFCEAIGAPELEHEQRFATHVVRGDHLDDLYEVVRPIIKAKPTEWLAARLTERGIMNGKVNTYRQFLTEEQVAASGIISWLDQPGVPEPVPMPNIPGLPPFESGTKRAHAPRLGEHTLEVLAEYGYSDAEIAALLEHKVVAAPGR